MAQEEQTPERRDRIKDLLIEEEMKDSYLTYAMSVIVSRALPDVRDGLKPSQRRILIAMNDLNLGPRSKTRKCAKIVGDTHGNYHPHGDAAIYQTLARMAQDFVMRYPLVEGQGNFGSMDGDPPAAPRYTEARMTEVTSELLADIEHETVDFVPNYDGTRQEPTVLPGRFPNLLCNGSTGIAVGMATNIPPQNVTEICTAIVELIDRPDIAPADLLKIVKGPDFPTGGLICGREGIRSAYLTGRGSVVLRARSHIETSKTGRKSIVFSEMAYGANPDNILRRAAELVKEGIIQGVSDLRNESDRSGTRVVVDLRKGEDERVVLNLLYKHTQLQDTFGVNIIALVAGQPRTLGLRDLLVAYVAHRKEVVTRRTKFLLQRDLDRAHIVAGLLIALANIDAIIEIIKKSPDPDTAGQRLMARFGLSERQVKAILDMRLARLTGLERGKLEQEQAELEKRIAGYRAILDDERVLMGVIREETLDIKGRFGDKRRTEIVGEVEEFDREDLVAEENVVVTISHEGYLKRQPLNAYRKQRHGGKGITGAEHKEGDFTEHLFIASTHDSILLFTDLGRVYWLKVYNVPEMGRMSRGRALVNLLPIPSDEKITSFIPVRDFSEGDLLMATAQGTVKRTPLSDYGRPKKTGIIAIGLDEGDRLIGVRHIFPEQQVMLATRDGMAIRFPEKTVRRMGRSAHGVRGIRLEKDDLLVGLILADEKTTVLTVCENGYGKRTAVGEYRLTNRGGKGVINIKTTERNGKVIAVVEAHDDDEMMIMTERGMVIRCPMANVRTIGRNTQGVRVITLDEGDRAVVVARLAKEDAVSADEAAPDAAPSPASSSPVEPPAAEETAPEAENPEPKEPDEEPE
ncbi:MAG: DNA gyrase subunit A [Candidatus Brocadiia bacterium]